MKCLENRVAVLENQNKALIEELKTLKELYCRKDKQGEPMVQGGGGGGGQGRPPGGDGWKQNE